MFAEKQHDDLKRRLAIDQLDLDGELMRLAPDTQTVAELRADALQLRDACKTQLDVASARAASSLRSGAEKLSEQRISSEIPLNNDVQEAIIALDDAKHDAAYWQALVQSYGEKGSSLRRICEMMLAGFLTPSSVYQARRSQMNQQREAARDAAPNQPGLRRRGA